MGGTEDSEEVVVEDAGASDLEKALTKQFPHGASKEEIANFLKLLVRTASHLTHCLQIRDCAVSHRRDCCLFLKRMDLFMKLRACAETTREF